MEIWRLFYKKFNEGSIGKGNLFLQKGRTTLNKFMLLATSIALIVIFAIYQPNNLSLNLRGS